MSTVALIHVNELARPARSADNLTKPIYWCGQKWAQLYDLGEGSVPYKILQVALRIIPTVLLAVATGFSAWLSMGPTYWVAKFVCETFDDMYNNAHGVSNEPDKIEVEVAMDTALQDRCRHLRLDGSSSPVDGFRDVLRTSIASNLQLGRFDKVGIAYADHVFQGGATEPSMVIKVSSYKYTRSFELLSLGYKNPNTSYEAMRYPFRNHEDVKEVAGAILGISDGSDAAIERVQTALHHVGVVNLVVSRNLQHMQLQLNASRW